MTLYTWAGATSRDSNTGERLIDGTLCLLESNLYVISERFLCMRKLDLNASTR